MTAEKIITAWWNDTMRKDYRTALEDPGTRHERLLELAGMFTTATEARISTEREGFQGRITELQEACNRELEKRREAEAKLDEWGRTIVCVYCGHTEVAPTREEVSRSIVSHVLGCQKQPFNSSGVMQKAKAAQDFEREECAKVAEYAGGMYDPQAAEGISAAIRAREKES